MSKMRVVVPYEGKPDANIYLIGEAPGYEETIHERPFVGSAGKILDRLLQDSGISRGECRIGNVCRVRPPGNKFEWFYAAEQKELYESECASLKRDIARVRPNVIVTLGNHPLKALMGHSGVTDWRGSILQYNGCKLVPTYHPSALQYGRWDWAPLITLDLKKALAESETSQYHKPLKHLVVNPNFQQVLKELSRLNRSDMVAFDTETTRPKKGEVGQTFMTAIAFSDASHYGFCIPFTKQDGKPYWTAEEEAAIIEGVRTLMENKSVRKIAHNSQFDMGVLQHNYGIKTAGLYLDTMAALHTVYPELPKSLNQARTMFSRQPYYDHWAKKGDFHFQRYNAMDAAVCREIVEPLLTEMEDLQVKDFYFKHVHPLLPVLLEMQMRGVRIDEEKRAALDSQLEFDLVTRDETFKTLFVPKGYVAGKNYRKKMKIENKIRELEKSGKWQKKDGLPAKRYINWKKKLIAFEGTFNVASPEQMKCLLKDIYKVKVKSTDNDSLKKMSNLKKTNKQVVELCDSVLARRKSAKLLGTYIKAPLYKGRMHTCYNVGGRVERSGDIEAGPVTGRLSSSESIVLNAGTNLQNIPTVKKAPEFRKMFLPDIGMKMLEVDLSQAENRVVAYLAEEERLIKAYENGEDVHSMYAEWIGRDRDMGKKVNHACNYGISAFELARKLRIPKAEAAGYLRQVFGNAPGIKRWQDNIANRFQQGKRVMTTFFGRRRQFLMPYSQDLLKSAYAYEPQSTVGDLLNLALMRFNTLMPLIPIPVQLLLQVHDSFALQYPPRFEEEIVMRLRKDVFNIPLTINGRTFTIPIDVKVGPSWGELEEIS